MSFSASLTLSPPRAFPSSPQSPEDGPHLVQEFLGATFPQFKSSKDLERTRDSLPEEDRRRLDAMIPTFCWGELKSLSREADPQLLEEGLFLLAEKAEDRRNPLFSNQLYLFLETSSHDSIRGKVRKKLAVQRGKGDFKDFAEYCFVRFSKELADPANILSAAAGVGAFRAARYLIGARLAQASQLPMAYKVLSNATGWLVASGAGTFAEKLVKSSLAASWEGWTEKSLARDMLINALSFGLILGNVKLLTAHLKPGALSAKPWMAFGTLGGYMIATSLSKRLGLITQDDGKTAPNTDEVMQGAALAVHFLLARGLSNAIGGDNFVQKETALFDRGIFTPAKL